LSTLFYVLLAFRLLTVIISARNEKRLKKMGAIEFGKRNSGLLIGLHFLFYGAAITEGYLKNAFYRDGTAVAGIGIYVFAIFILYYVIFAIRHVWTVKLMIAPTGYHKINRGVLFRYVRHPNYFLNILPELVGIGLIFHAWYTLAIGLPLYLVPLVNRIREEERVMGEYFEDYK
jgi:isoprenylcysteine carboxyl methyltransferase (ICMT) family protein YpbQ